uniref:CHHC U11-48K-type domain-containing protein n=1 Tax=Megaselia scalaris TaxID=36166 RepID=T1H2L7_MEGSC
MESLRDTNIDSDHILGYSLSCWIYERPYEPRKRYEDDRDHYYEDRHRRETEYPPAYDDRRHASSRRSRSPAPRYDRERDRSRDREETKKSEYEIEYDPKTRTFQGPSVKGSGPQPAYVAAKSMPIPKSSDYDDKPKRRKARKGPIANYMDPDIYPNEKVICPYNNAHIVQRKRLQGHLLYCRKKFPNPNLKICPLNVLHVVKEEELEKNTDTALDFSYKTTLNVTTKPQNAVSRTANKTCKMSRYYAEYVPPPSRRSYDRSPPPYLRDRERERDRVREYESSSRRYERRSR